MTTTVQQQHREGTLLEKARIERRLWDSLSKEQKAVTTRAKWLAEQLGVEPREATCRSNLLKRGVHDPHIWARFEEGKLTYEQAIRTHTNGAKPRRPVTASRPATKPKSKTSKPPSLPADVQQQVDTLVADLRQQIETLAKGVQASAAVELPTEPPKPEFVDPVTLTDAFYNELKARVWEWFKDNDFIGADYHGISGVVSSTLTEFYETLEYFRRSCKRLAGKRVSLVKPGMGLHKAFKALGIAPQDPTDPNFDLLVARRAFKKLARRYHPDRNDGKAIYREEYQEINDAIQAIERVYETARLAKGTSVPS